MLPHPAHPIGQCTSLEGLCRSRGGREAEAHCLWMHMVGVSVQHVLSACRHVLIVVPKGFVFSYGVLVEKSAMSFSVATGLPGTVNLLHHHRAQSRALGELGTSCVFRSFFYRCAFPFLGKGRVWQPFTPLPWALPSAVWSLANQGRQPSCRYCWSCNK